MTDTSDTLTRWHALVKSRDISGLDGLLADDVVFYSPVSHSPQIGKARTLPYLEAAFLVFLNDSFTYVREFVKENDAVLEFSVELDGVMVNGVDMVRWDGDGKITEFKVMLRPLKAVNLIQEKMSEMLTHSRESR